MPVTPLMWDYHAENSQRVILNLRPLFLAIDFDEVSELKPLFKACRFWKKLLKSNKSLTSYPLSRIPVEHIHPKALREQFKVTKTVKGRKKATIDQHQYEFYLYRSLRENIKNRKIAINSSENYKSFDKKVNTPADWNENAQSHLLSLNNKELIKPIETILSDLKSILEPLLERTNQRALNEENQQIKITRHRDGSVSWTLPYVKNNPEFDNDFYKQLEVKTISEIYDYVAKACGFPAVLLQSKSRYGRYKQDYLATKGVILANGTMQGINLFSKRSNLTYQRLKTAEDNHVHLQSLRAAADLIIDEMLALPIYDRYLIDNKLHGSVV